MRKSPMNLTDSTVKTVFGYKVHCIMWCLFHQPSGENPLPDFRSKTAENPLSNGFDPMATVSRQGSFPLNPHPESSA